jgi:hypothetical protein
VRLDVKLLDDGSKSPAHAAASLADESGLAQRSKCLIGIATVARKDNGGS